MARQIREQIFHTEMVPHYRAVYNFLTRMAGSAADGADLTQETFARAFVKLDGYAEGTNAKAWLFKIGYNLFVNDYRKQVRRATDELDERIAYGKRDEAHALARFSDLRVEGSEEDFTDPIMKALGTLKPLQRSVIIMSDLYDYSEKEIMDVTGLKHNTVKSTIRRARIELIKLLESYAGREFGIVNTRNLGR